MDDTTRDTLREALFTTSLDGIRATGESFPLGGFILVGAMIDMLAGLRYAPAKNGDRQQGTRYADFVHEYFPHRYRAEQLGPVLWRHLRCTALHNFSSTALALGDRQPGEHLSRIQGRIILNWSNTLEDYTDALGAYWAAMTTDPVLEANAEDRCKTYPPFTVRFYGRGVSFPVTFPMSFGGGASGYGS